MTVTNSAAGARSFAATPVLAPDVAVSGARLTTARVLMAHVLSLSHRIRRGEGQLLAINVSLVLATRPGLFTLVAQTLLSALVLVVLYFVNDVIDAPGDVHDGGKDQAHVRLLLDHRTYFIKLLVIEHGLLPFLAYLLNGATSALAVAGVLAVNLAYSYSLKGRAFIDVPWVALWGSLYALCTGITFPVEVYAVVGLMTGITHVFQIMRDRRVDAINAVQTSAVARSWLPPLQMTVACAAMGACWSARLGWLAGVSAAVPLVLLLTLRSNQNAWLLAKVHFGVLWLWLLSSSHEL